MAVSSQIVMGEDAYDIPYDVFEDSCLFPCGPSRGLPRESFGLLLDSQNWSRIAQEDGDHKAIMWTGDTSAEGFRYTEDNNSADWPEFKGERGGAHVGIMFSHRTDKLPVFGFARVGARMGGMRSDALARDHAAKFMTAGLDVEGDYKLSWALGGYDAGLAATVIQESDNVPISFDAGVALFGYYGGISADADYTEYDTAGVRRIISQRTESETRAFIASGLGPFIGMRRDIGILRFGANAGYAFVSQRLRSRFYRHTRSESYQEVVTQPYAGVFLDDRFYLVLSAARVDVLADEGAHSPDKDYYVPGIKLTYSFSPRFQAFLGYETVIGYEDYQSHAIQAGMGIYF